MTDERFWQLIADNVDVDDACEVTSVERLEAALSRLSAREIADFDAIFDHLYVRSYRTDLWGAAYLFNGGCSEDRFDAFRGWLIARGRAVYEAVLRDPDCLGDHCDGYAECEEMLYVAPGAYEAVAGAPIERVVLGAPELGARWDVADLDELRRRYPRLAARASE